MMSLVIERADVQMSQPVGEVIENARALLHTRIDVGGMRYVEAKACLGKRGEEDCKLGCGPALRLARIHVLQHESIAECSVDIRIVNRVGVHHDSVGDRKEAHEICDALALRSQ